MSLITNPKATFNYEVVERFETGIELLGVEVKSVRAKHGSLVGAFVKFLGGEAFLTGADIPAYQVANAPKDFDRLRARKLLLSKKELLELEQKVMRDGLTIVPISLYNKASGKGGKIKAEIALVKGKKVRDKRQTIKKRESDREIQRSLKN